MCVPVMRGLPEVIDITGEGAPAVAGHRKGEWIVATVRETEMERRLGEADGGAMARIREGWVCYENEPGAGPNAPLAVVALRVFDWMHSDRRITAAGYGWGRLRKQLLRLEVEPGVKFARPVMDDSQEPEQHWVRVPHASVARLLFADQTSSFNMRNMLKRNHYMTDSVLARLCSVAQDQIGSIAVLPNSKRNHNALGMWFTRWICYDMLFYSEDCRREFDRHARWMVGRYGVFAGSRPLAPAQEGDVRGAGYDADVPAIRSTFFRHTTGNGDWKLSAGAEGGVDVVDLNSVEAWSPSAAEGVLLEPLDSVVPGLTALVDDTLLPAARLSATSSPVVSSPEPLPSVHLVSPERELVLHGGKRHRSPISPEDQPEQQVLRTSFGRREVPSSPMGSPSSEEVKLGEVGKGEAGKGEAGKGEADPPPRHHKHELPNYTGDTVPIATVVTPDNLEDVLAEIKFLTRERMSLRSFLLYDNENLVELLDRYAQIRTWKLIVAVSQLPGMHTGMPEFRFLDAVMAGLKREYESADY